MATSARTQQLLNQRQAFKIYSKFQGSRSLSPNSLGARTATLAKKNIEDELSIKIKQYNDGLISNEDMRAFLNTTRDNSTLSAAEKEDISAQIRSFDEKIRIEKLEAAYKNAPDNSMAKVNAATSLANYFDSSAAGKIPDTPAHSQAISQAGQWRQVATKEVDQIEKLARSEERAKLFREVAINNDKGTVEEAQAKSEAYLKLAEQAYADGDTTQAMQLETQAQNELNKVPGIIESQNREILAGNKKELNKYINEATNDYKDGKISTDTYLAQLGEADKAAAELGDAAIQVRLNTLAQGVYRDIDKGISYSSTGDAFGERLKGGGGYTDGILYDPVTGALSFGSVPTGGGSGGRGGIRSTTGGGVGLATTIGAPSAGGNQPATQTDQPKSLTELDRNYEQNLRDIHSWFLQGFDAQGNPFDGEDYKNSLAILSADRRNDLTNIVGALETANLDDKTYYRGAKKQIEDLLNSYAKELDGVRTEALFYGSADAVPIFDLGTQGNLKGVPELRWDLKSNIDNFDNNYTEDFRGIYRKLQEERQYFNTPEEEAAFFQANPQFKGKVAGQEGQRYVVLGKYVDIPDEATGYTIRYSQSPDGLLLPLIDENAPDDVKQRLQFLSDAIEKDAQLVSEAQANGFVDEARKIKGPVSLSQLDDLFAKDYFKPILEPSLEGEFINPVTGRNKNTVMVDGKEVTVPYDVDLSPLAANDPMKNVTRPQASVDLYDTISQPFRTKYNASSYDLPLSLKPLDSYSPTTGALGIGRSVADNKKLEVVGNTQPNALQKAASVIGPIKVEEPPGFTPGKNAIDSVAPIAPQASYDPPSENFLQSIGNNISNFASQIFSSPQPRQSSQPAVYGPPNPATGRIDGMKSNPVPAPAPRPAPAPSNQGPSILDQAKKVASNIYNTVRGWLPF